MIELFRGNHTTRFATYLSPPGKHILLTSGIAPSPHDSLLVSSTVWLQVAHQGSVRPVAYAQEEVTGAEKRTSTSLQFFSTGPFREHVVNALVKAVHTDVQVSDDGFVNVGSEWSSENQAAKRLRALVTAPKKQWVESTLATLGEIAGTELRSELLVMTPTKIIWEGPFTKQLEEKAELLKNSFRVTIRSDLNAPRFETAVRDAAQWDALIINAHAGEGLKIPRDYYAAKSYSLADIESLVSSAKGPAMIAISGCFSTSPVEVFTSKGPSSLGIGTTAPEAEAQSVFGFLDYLAGLYDSDPSTVVDASAPASASNGLFQASVQAAARSANLNWKKFFGKVASRVKSFSDLSPYSNHAK